MPGGLSTEHIVLTKDVVDRIVGTSQEKQKQNNEYCLLEMPTIRYY